VELCAQIKQEGWGVERARKRLLELADDAQRYGTPYEVAMSLVSGFIRSAFPAEITREEAHRVVTADSAKSSPHLARDLVDRINRSPQSGSSTPVTVRMDQVRLEPLSWLWPSRIPFGKLTVIEGDPGLGKSLLTLDIAARLTRGEELPDVPA
jgi:hypothetical protein